LPDLVFTANAGLIFGQRFFSSQFRHAVRARESPFFDEWFAVHGFTVEHLPAGMYFEGAGDALFCGPTLFAGYRIRSDVSGHQYLGKQLQRQVLPLELVDPRFYHLDTCFCPLNSEAVLIYPQALAPTSLNALKNNWPRVHEITEAEAIGFVANGIVAGGHYLTPRITRNLGQILDREKLQPVVVETSEFEKSGGSCYCMKNFLE